MAEKIFGTDGIRGRANHYPISPDMVLKLGQAIGLSLKQNHQKPRVLIGKDTRRSGYLLEQALSAGICSVGVDTALLGPLPTPGIAYLTRGMRASAGIVLSASHNPYYDNGIKIFSSDGYKLPDSAEIALTEKVFSKDLAINLPTGRAVGTSRRIDDAMGQYAVFLKEQFPKHLTLEGFRIVLDCAHGAAYRVAPKVFEELGAEVFVLGNQPDGTNINDQCGALHPQDLVEKVSLYKADIGIALDGDADRLIVVDNKAQIVDGDQILAICAQHYLEEKRLAEQTLVATIMSNMGLDRCLSDLGGRVVRTAVGDRNVVAEMRKGAYNLGGEQSGHLIFHDCATTGDGLLAALSLLEIIIEKGKSVYELKQCMELMPQVLRNVDVIEKVPVQELPSLKKLIQECEKSLGDHGRVLFRYSGTEHKARVMVEGANQDVIENMASKIIHETMESIRQYTGGRKNNDTPMAEN
ncbi:MAG: phosphoglucosamine mutase [Oligoflexales bacterium]